MAKLSSIFEAFLGIILTLSLLTFGWAYFDVTGAIDAQPVQQVVGANDAVSESALNAPEAAITQPTASQETAASAEEEPEPESITFTTYTPPSSNTRNNHRPSKKTSGVQQDLADDGSARVIVTLSEPSNKAAVKSSLESQGAQTNAEWSDGIAVTASQAAIDSLENDNSVAMIEEDLPLQTMTYEGYDLIDFEKVLADDILTLNTINPLTSKYLNTTGSLSLTGAGQTVAMIDSGIINYHPEFVGKIVAEWDFYENDSISFDDWNHGTKMAGVIAAKGVNMDGIAPDANIIALRITNSTGGAWTSSLYNALDWVAKNASKYNITTVYVGVGKDLYDGTELACAVTGVYMKINELTNKNITVVAPAGHDGDISHIAYPACVANTISVGGVPDGGFYPADTWNLTAGGVQSNRRDGLLDLLAPGGEGATMTTNRPIIPDYPYNYTGGTGTGTSVSAAYVAGASMLLREFWDADSWNFRPAGLVNGNIPNTIEYIFKQAGVQIEDELNPGVYYPRLDIFAAINYEENNPVVTLETANESVVAPGTVTLEYNVQDQHNIDSCSLYIDNALNQTDNTITRGTTQSFSVNLEEAVYNWRVECDDTATVPNTGVSATNSIIVITIDTEAPKYSGLSAIPGTYAPSQVYALSATWTDNVAIGSVILQFDGVNYTDATNAGDVYTRYFAELPAGTYNYVWYANDTSGNENNTGIQVFTINKASTNLNWNTTPGWNVISGTQTRVQCISGNAESVIKLYRNGVEVSNPDVQTLTINTYDYVCNTTGSQNYTDDEITNTLTVSSKNPSTATLTFDKVSPQTYGTTIKATCADTNPEATAKLFRNGVDVTASENDVAVTLAAGTYNYVCNVSETANYLSAEDTDSFTINKAEPSVTLGSNPSWSVVSGTQTTVSCTTSTPGIALKLFRAGVEVSSPDVQTLAVNTYAYVCNTTGNENYSAASASNTLAVSSKNPSTATLVFDKVSPQTYGTTIKATCTDTNPEATAKLFRDGVDVTASENDIAVTLAAGTYNYVCNVSETANYLSAEDTDSFTINKAVSSLTLGSNPSWSVVSGTQTTVSCTTSTPGIALKLFRDGVEVSSPDVQTLAVNTYDYVCNTTGNENYSAGTVSNTLAVSSKNPSTATLVFDKVSPQVYGTTIKATCTDTNPEATAKLFRDGVDVTASENDIAVTLAAGTYNYVCNVSETANYLSTEDTDSFTINKASTTVTLSSSPSWSISEGTQTTVSCSADNTEVSAVLARNGTVVSSPDVQTLAAGTYSYVCSADATQNYTADSGSSILTVTPTANIPPTLSGLPDQVTDEDSADVIVFDLQPYATDTDGNVSLGTFALDSQSNPTLIDCMVLHNSTSDYALCLQPEANMSGYSDVAIKFTDEDGAFDTDTFRVTVTPVDDPTYWLPLSNKAVNEDSASGTVVYASLANQCIDIDSVIGPIAITSSHSHYSLAFSGNDLIINSLEANWFGTETVNLDCNGVSASFSLAVNDVADVTCYTVCAYGRCYEICE